MGLHLTTTREEKEKSINSVVVFFNESFLQNSSYMVMDLSVERLLIVGCTVVVMITRLKAIYTSVALYLISPN